MEIRQLEPEDGARVARFLAHIPDADRTFFKEDVSAPDAVDRWTAPGAERWVVVEHGEILGAAAVVPLHGWSSHVGDLRLVVDPAQRGRGVGRMLAAATVARTLELGLKKLVVEVIATQDQTVGLFRSLGFDPEALLVDHVRDRDGELQDLMILAHSVDDQWSAMAVAGVEDDVT